MTFGVVVEAQCFNLAAERVAMDAEHLGGFGLVTAAAFQDAAKESPLEFRQCLRVKNPFLDHLPHENLELPFHKTPPGLENDTVRDALFVFRLRFVHRRPILLETGAKLGLQVVWHDIGDRLGSSYDIRGKR